MAEEENVKKIRIPIESSIYSYGTGYEVGPRIRKMHNVIGRWADSNGDSFPGLSIPEVPTLNGTLLDPPAEQAHGMGAWLSLAGDSHYLAGANWEAGTKDRFIYDVESGTALPVVGTSLGNNPVFYDWSFAFAPNISEPTTFVVNQACGKKKAVLVGGSLELHDYLPSFNPDFQPDFNAFPRFVYYHLNRIWLAYVSTTTRRTIVFFTDSLNPDVIRGESFLDIPDELTCIFRASASDIDLGAQSHLIFGCKSSFFILDGDPSLGNAVFRQLKKNFGIFDAGQQIETSEGAVFLGTDNRVYLFPRGALDPIPIAPEIRDKFSHISTSITFGWRIPYIYVFPNPDDCYIGDLTDPQNIYWSGPHDSQEVHSFYSDVPYEVKTYMIVLSQNEQVAIMAPVSPLRSPALIQTGYIFEQDSDVVFQRAWFDVVQGPAVQDFTLKIFNSDGLLDSFTFSIPAGSPSAGDTKLTKARVIAQPQTMEVGDYFYMELSANVNFMKNLRNWNIQYRVQPRKD